MNNTSYAQATKGMECGGGGGRGLRKHSHVKVWQLQNFHCCPPTLLVKERTGLPPDTMASCAASNVIPVESTVYMAIDESENDSKLLTVAVVGSAHGRTYQHCS